MLKYFRILTRFRRDICMHKKRSGQWCHWHCVGKLHGVKLIGVIDTAESSSAVSLISRSQDQQCHLYSGVKLSGVIDTEESNSAVSLIPPSQDQQCLLHHTVIKAIQISARYNMKCKGKHDTNEIFRVVSRFTRYISCYIAEIRYPLGQCRESGFTVSITLLSPICGI